MKNMFSYILILILACCLVGCGENSKNDLDQKELVYGYERLECMDEIKGEVMNFDAEGDYLYFYSGEYVQQESMGEEMVDSHFYKCKTDGSELVELPIKWDKADFEWLHSMEVSREGTLWLLFSAYSEELMTSTYILRLVDENGIVIKEVDINDHMDVEDFYVSDIKTDAEGNLYICSGYSILLFDKKGELTGIIEEEDSIENLVRTKSGDVWAGFCHKEKYVLKKIEPAEAAFCETYDTKLSYYDIVLGMDGPVHDFYYCQGEMLLGYDLATDESEGGYTEVLHFMASGLNTNSLGMMQVISEDTVLALYGVDSDEDPYGLYLFRKIDPKDVKVKKIITYASLYSDNEAKEMALRFNRNQDEYLVVVKDYENTDDNVMAFYKDLRAGEVIDIVDLSGMSSSDKYIAQGMFVDLYSFMKRDEEIKKEDFSENVLGIMETDGKLYHITPTYGINVVVAKEADIAGDAPLTFENLEEMEKDGAKAFYRETNTSVLMLLLEHNYHSYINWEEGTCSFDSEEFIQALEYCNTYPDEVDYTEESMTSKIRSDEILFAGAYSASAEDLQIYEKMFDEKIALLGYPSGEYSGAAMSFNRDFAICDSSTDKKGAWEFLKRFLSREYGAGDPYDTLSVPVRKDSLEDKIKRYTTKEEYTDAFGNRILPISYEWANEEVVMKVGPLDREGEALYRKVLQNIDRQYVYDTDIADILCEEADPYFNGDISAKETAVNIQNRVSVYMEDYKTED